MQLTQQVEHTLRTHRPEQGRPSVSRAHPCLFPSAPKPDSQEEGENAPKRIIRWLLGKKIVNGLVPFTKPQPKKVTYKIPERKQCCRLWLPAVDWSFGQLSTPEGGGGRDCVDFVHLSQSTLHKRHAAWSSSQGPWGGLPGATLGTGEDLFPKGSPCKSECPCREKEGAGRGQKA